jgi:hypothetical protein
MTRDQILTRSIARFSTPLARQLMQAALHPGAARALLSAFPMFESEPLLGVLAGAGSRLEAPCPGDIEAELRAIGIREALGSRGHPELARQAPGDLDGVLAEWDSATFAAPPRDEGAKRTRRLDTLDFEIAPGAGTLWPAWVELDTERAGRSERVTALRFAFRRPGYSTPEAVALAERRGEAWTHPPEEVTPSAPETARVRALLLARCLLTVRLQLDAHLPGHYVGAHIRAALARAPVAARSALGQAALTFTQDADASTALGAHVIVGGQGVFRDTPITPDGLGGALSAGIRARTSERLLEARLPGPVGRTLETVRHLTHRAVVTALPEIMAKTSREALDVYALSVNQPSEAVPGDFFGPLTDEADVGAHLELLAAYGCLGHTVAHALQDVLGVPTYGPLALRPAVELSPPRAEDPEAIARWRREILPGPSDGALVQLVTGEMLAAPNAHEAGRLGLAQKNPLRELPDRIAEGLEDDGIRRVSLSAAV